MESVLIRALADGGRSSLDAVVAAAGGEDAASDAVERLITLGLVQDERTTTGVTLSLQGRQVATAIRRSRLTGPYRRAAVQWALLRWLASGAEPDEVAEFVGHDAATSAGVPFTEEEIRRAAYALVFWQLVTSSKASPQHVQRPRTTPLGREAAEDSRTPHEFVRAARRTTTSDQDGGVSVRSGSNLGREADPPDGVVIATQPVAADARIRVLAKASEILGVLGEDGSPDVRSAIEAVRDEAASSAPTVSSLHDRALTAMVAAVGAGVAEQIVKGLAQLAELIA
jgi:hypothetical protein